MERDDVAPKHKAKISIPEASYRVLRNFCSRPYDAEHRTCAFKKGSNQILTIRPTMDTP